MSVTDAERPWMAPFSGKGAEGACRSRDAHPRLREGFLWNLDLSRSRSPRLGSAGQRHKQGHCLSAGPAHPHDPGLCRCVWRFGVGPNSTEGPGAGLGPKLSKILKVGARLLGKETGSQHA